MIYQFSDCIFDTTRDEIRRSDEVLHTTPQVLLVLRYLLEQRDRVVSRDELLEQCWPESNVSDEALTSCLRRVRQVIGQTRTGPTLIETLHRRGYRFVAEVTEFAEIDPALPDVETAPRVMSDPGSEELPAAEREGTPVSVPESLAMTERRHLTVLSCTLADAEHLTQQLDPEDHYDLLQTFRATALAIITSNDGYVAQHIDDGLLVYFGYPQAYEDAAARAVRSGLALVQALSRIAVVGLAGGQAGVGVGIDSGIVLVSSGIGLTSQQALAMGSPLTRAGQLSKLARPGTVVISEATAQLVVGYFDCKALRDLSLAGQPESQVSYEVLGESAMQTRIEVGMARGLTPFVGREAELALLRDRWTYVQEGMGQVVMLRGEAGIGKSRLLQALKDQVVDEQLQPVECRCSPYYQHTALYPVIDVLQYTLQRRSDMSGDNHFETLEALLGSYRIPLDESVPLLAGLLSLPIPDGRYPPLHLTPQRQREQTLDMLLALLVAQASQAPILFIVEDLHWADPSTLEFLELLMGQVPTTAMLVVLTCRPTFAAPWSTPTWLTPMTLHRLTQPQLHQMITQVAGGKTFSAEVMTQLAETTDGVPLFVEELTRTVLEIGQFEETDERYELVGELAQLSIPSTLQDSLMSRLDRLGRAKEIAQWGAVLGREFTDEVIRKVTPHDEVVFKEGLDQLVESELVFQRGLGMHAQYRFKHALVQNVAYQSLRRRERQNCHRRIAQVLAEAFPETAVAQPELLAHHYTEAGEDAAAVVYWQQAGQRALHHSANQEAIAHLTRGLALLARLPETLARHQQELPLQTALGTASLMIRGHAAPEVEAAYTRARLLCQQLGDTQDVFPVLFGLWRFYVSMPDFAPARQLSKELLDLAEQRDEIPLYVVAHYAFGWTCFCLGEPLLAQSHLEGSIARYTPSQRGSPMFRAGQDPGVAGRAFAACTLWCLGYPDQALKRAHDALVLATELAHPFSRAYALDFMSIIRHFRRENQNVYEYAEAAATLSAEQGFTFWLAMSTVLRGWALTARGQEEGGLTQMRQGLTDRRVSGAEVFVPYFLTLLAEGYGNLEQAEAGLEVLEKGLEVMERTDEHWWKAEVCRLKGELLSHQASPDMTQAETCFQQALDIARQQQAKSLELRAATSLARRWQQQGKPRAAHELLAPVYGWFSEGFDTADLIDARALLEALEAGRS